MILYDFLGFVCTLEACNDRNYVSFLALEYCFAIFFDGGSAIGTREDFDSARQGRNL